MEAGIKGKKHNPVHHQLKASNTFHAKEDSHQKAFFVETPSLHEELRKAALRWVIYRFPVKYTPNQAETDKLSWLPKWQLLNTGQKAEAVDSLLVVYNA